MQKRNHAATSMCSNVVRNHLKPIDFSGFERPIFFFFCRWYLTKLQLREVFTEKLKAKRAEDTQNFVDLVMTDKMQNLLGKYLSSLKKNK